MKWNQTKQNTLLTAHCSLPSALSLTFIAFLFIFHSSLWLSPSLGFLFPSVSASGVPFLVCCHIDLHINFPKSSGQCKIMFFFFCLVGHFRVCIACGYVMQCMFFFSFFSFGIGTSYGVSAS